MYGIVRQNDGYIEVDSAPGRGATFRIFLPRAETPVEGGPADREAGAGSTGAAKPRDRRTVLVVEDEPTLLDLVVRMVERLGHRAVSADTPGEALTIASRHPGTIDTLLTDVLMPSMDGRELASRFRKLHPGAHVVFMSGHAEDVLAERGVVPGDVCFLAKPFEMEALEEALGEGPEGGSAAE